MLMMGPTEVSKPVFCGSKWGPSGRHRTVVVLTSHRSVGAFSNSPLGFGPESVRAASEGSE